MRGSPSGHQIMIVGLGNPGKNYARHRHNLGFMVVNELAGQTDASWKTNREKSLICDIEIADKRVTLLKPQTFMNLSGKAVAPVLRRLNANPEAMIAIHDDLDLAFGKVRIKVGGGDGGHKGIRSIADSLRFRDFVRVRLGIGRPPAGVAPDEFVLTNFASEEDSTVKDLIEMGSCAVRLILNFGVEQAQNAIHAGRKAACDAAIGS
ncbi:MAG: aminoacyl-tRNA hydrolase [Desulfomonile tiedjei]|nr:aminoacyl-tRNA hydrolase [Desulfomonile tiedjei]